MGWGDSVMKVWEQTLVCFARDGEVRRFRGCELQYLLTTLGVS